MKYAISQISGKQLIIKPNQWYDIDFLKNTNKGDILFLKKILFLRTEKYVQVGHPFLVLSQIPALIINHVAPKKIMVIKTKPKKKYTRIRGHKQKYTRIKILNNNFDYGT